MKIILLLFTFLLFAATTSTLLVSAANTCSEFTFPNGSKVSFSDASAFVGYWPQMNQNDYTAAYPWSMSLCDNSIAAAGAPACAKGDYMSQESTCSLAVTQTPSISAYGTHGITFTFPASTQETGYTWTNTVNCDCDRNANNLVSPTNLYTATVAGQSVTGTWVLRSKGCCVDVPVPPPSPTVTPAPGSTCPVINFPNGSVISFSNPSSVAGYWPSLDQVGTILGNYPWSVSLCSPQVHASGAMGCATGNYMAQNPDCSFVFNEAPTVAALADGTGASFTFADEQVGPNTWSAVATCICDPSRESLYIPSGNYNADLSGPTGNIIKLTWAFLSAGCCIDGTPTPSPPAPTPQCTPITFPNGSKITFPDASPLTGYWSSIQQFGSVTGSYRWSASLCSPSVQATFAMGCAANTYMAMNNDCSFAFSNQPAVSPLPDGSGILYDFPSTAVGSNTWSALVTCVCNPSSYMLNAPTDSYNADVSGPSGNVVKLTWNLQSKGCCIDQNGSSTSTSAPLPVPTTTSSSSTTCPVINFPNGSKISFSNPSAVAGYWQSVHQVGDVVGSFPWSVSLCDPQLQAAGAMGCAVGNYMAQNPDCSFVFNEAPTVTALADGTGAQFTFADEAVGPNTFSASVSCICDPSHQNLYVPSGNYNADVSGPSGNIIKFTWAFQSGGCCIDQETTTTTTTTTAAPLPPPSTSTSTTTTTTATATTATPSPSAPSPTTTPSPSSNNHHGGNGPSSDSNCSCPLSKPIIKYFVLPAAGAAVGVILVAFVYCLYKKCCRSDDGENDRHGGGGTSSRRGDDDLRGGYQEQLYPNDAEDSIA